MNYDGRGKKVPKWKGDVDDFGFQCCHHNQNYCHCFIARRSMLIRNLAEHCQLSPATVVATALKRNRRSIVTDFAELRKKISAGQRISGNTLPIVPIH